MMNERRIAELQGLLRNADVVDESSLPKDDIVRLGSTVIVDFDGEEEAYQIVGPLEAKPAAGRISNESPMGKQLLGRKTGETATYIMPNGRENTVKILRVEN